MDDTAKSVFGPQGHFAFGQQALRHHARHPHRAISLLTSPNTTTQ